MFDPSHPTPGHAQQYTAYPQPPYHATTYIRAGAGANVPQNGPVVDSRAWNSQMEVPGTSNQHIVAMPPVLHLLGPIPSSGGCFTLPPQPTSGELYYIPHATNIPPPSYIPSLYPAALPPGISPSQATLPSISQQQLNPRIAPSTGFIPRFPTPSASLPLVSLESTSVTSGTMVPEMKAAIVPGQAVEPVVGSARHNWLGPGMDESVKAEPPNRRRKVTVYKDVSLETDFNDSIAQKSLVELPNDLYIEGSGVVDICAENQISGSDPSKRHRGTAMGLGCTASALKSASNKIGSVGSASFDARSAALVSVAISIGSVANAAPSVSAVQLSADAYASAQASTSSLDAGVNKQMESVGNESKLNIVNNVEKSDQLGHGLNACAAEYNYRGTGGFPSLYSKSCATSTDVSGLVQSSSDIQGGASSVNQAVLLGTVGGAYPQGLPIVVDPHNSTLRFVGQPMVVKYPPYPGPTTGQLMAMPSPMPLYHGGYADVAQTVVQQQQQQQQQQYLPLPSNAAANQNLPANAHVPVQYVIPPSSFPSQSQQFISGGETTNQSYIAPPLQYAALPPGMQTNQYASLSHQGTFTQMVPSGGRNMPAMINNKTAENSRNYLDKGIAAGEPPRHAYHNSIYLGPSENIRPHSGPPSFSGPARGGTFTGKYPMERGSRPSSASIGQFSNQSGSWTGTRGGATGLVDQGHGKSMGSSDVRNSQQGGAAMSQVSVEGGANTGGGVANDTVLPFLNDNEFPQLLSAAGGLVAQSDCLASASSSMTTISMAHNNIGSIRAFNQAPYRNVLKGSSNYGYQGPRWRGMYAERQVRPNQAFTSPARDFYGMRDQKLQRKKQKRQELADQAATEELAEISLEQQVLRELGSKRFLKTGILGQVPGPLVPAAGLVNQSAQISAERGEGLRGEGAVLNVMNDMDTGRDRENSPVVGSTAGVSISSDNTLYSARGISRVGLPIKTKKCSSLKKVILKERQEQLKQRRENGELVDDEDDDEDDDVVVNNDNDNTEAERAGEILSLAKVVHEAGLGKADTSSISATSLAKLAPHSSGVHGEAGGSEEGEGAGMSPEGMSPVSQMSPMDMSPLSQSPAGSTGVSPIAGNGMLGSAYYNGTNGLCNALISKIHSRRFREYCNQILDKEIDDCCTLLLQDLVKFQDRLYHKDPTKARSKRRFVLGLREVTKHLKLKKLKGVIISPNLERIQSKGGLDEALNTIIQMSQEQTVPFIFALGRRALGRACAKLVPVSVVGIFDYEGSEANFNKLISLREKARQAYNEMITNLESEMTSVNGSVSSAVNPATGPASTSPGSSHETESAPVKPSHPVSSTIGGFEKLYPHMGHSRTPSACSAISFISSILSEPISENYPQSEPETDSRGYELPSGSAEKGGSNNAEEQDSGSKVEEGESGKKDAESAELANADNSDDVKNENKNEDKDYDIKDSVSADIEERVNGAKMAVCSQMRGQADKKKLDPVGEEPVIDSLSDRSHSPINSPSQSEGGVKKRSAPAESDGGHDADTEDESVDDTTKSKALSRRRQTSGSQKKSSRSSRNRLRDSTGGSSYDSTKCHDTLISGNPDLLSDGSKHGSAGAMKKDRLSEVKRDGSAKLDDSVKCSALNEATRTADTALKGEELLRREKSVKHDNILGEDLCEPPDLLLVDRGGMLPRSANKDRIVSWVEETKKYLGEEGDEGELQDPSEEVCLDDEVVESGSMDGMIDAVDEVHENRNTHSGTRSGVVLQSELENCDDSVMVEKKDGKLSKVVEKSEMEMQDKDLKKCDIIRSGEMLEGEKDVKVRDDVVGNLNSEDIKIDEINVNKPEEKADNDLNLTAEKNIDKNYKESTNKSSKDIDVNMHVVKDSSEAYNTKNLTNSEVECNNLNECSTEVNKCSTEVDSTEKQVCSTDVNKCSTEINKCGTEINKCGTDIDKCSTEIDKNMKGCEANDDLLADDMKPCMKCKAEAIRKIKSNLDLENDEFPAINRPANEDVVSTSHAMCCSYARAVMNGKLMKSSEQDKLPQKRVDKDLSTAGSKQTSEGLRNMEKQDIVITDKVSNVVSENADKVDIVVDNSIMICDLKTRLAEESTSSLPYKEIPFKEHKAVLEGEISVEANVKDNSIEASQEVAEETAVVNSTAKHSPKPNRKTRKRRKAAALKAAALDQSVDGVVGGAQGYGDFSGDGIESSGNIPVEKSTNDVAETKEIPAGSRHGNDAGNRGNGNDGEDLLGTCSDSGDSCYEDTVEIM